MDLSHGFESRTLSGCTVLFLSLSLKSYSRLSYISDMYHSVFLRLVLARLSDNYEYHVSSRQLLYVNLSDPRKH
jgi:hypothetical protein